MICDMADVTMEGVIEEEKYHKHLAPTPSAAHNPDFTMTGDGGEFQATKKTKMAKKEKVKDASNIQQKMFKMSNISKNVESAYKELDLVNSLKTSTKPKEEVAVAEISLNCSKMSTFKKEMGECTTAVSTHSVSELRQINMADNI